MTTYSVRALCLAIAVVVGMSPVAVGDGHAHPVVVPPDATFRGMTYGEWAAAWWQRAFSIPIVNGDHPLFSGGPFPGEKGVTFAAAVVGIPATVEFAIPAGTPLFFPIVNYECSFIEPPPFHGDDEQEMRECANAFLEHTSGVFASIDGRPIPNIDAFRGDSPLFEFGPLPADNLLGEPVGATSEAVDAGIYLLLRPLNVGRHEIHFGATIEDFGAMIDMTFIVHVLPHIQHFHAVCTGDQEVGPVVTRARSVADLTLLSFLDQQLLITTRIDQRLSSRFTAAHIHNAPRGVNGMIVVPFDPPIVELFGFAVSLDFDTSADLVGPLAGKTLLDLAVEIKNGDAYVNVHTVNHPTGEVRGQIE